MVILQSFWAAILCGELIVVMDGTLCNSFTVC